MRHVSRGCGPGSASTRPGCSSVRGAAWRRSTTTPTTRRHAPRGLCGTEGAQWGVGAATTAAAGQQHQGRRPTRQPRRRLRHGSSWAGHRAAAHPAPWRAGCGACADGSLNFDLLELHRPDFATSKSESGVLPTQRETAGAAAARPTRAPIQSERWLRRPSSSSAPRATPSCRPASRGS